MKKLTSCSTLVMPALAAMLQQYGDSVGKDFSGYIHPTFSSMAIGHIEGTTMNGIVTIDIDQTEKSAKIYLSSKDTLTADQSTSLLKFALLKAINLGCKSATVNGASGIEKHLEDSEFGPISTNGSSKNSIEFNELPSADFRTLGLYSLAGYTSGAIAFSSILAHSFFGSLSYLLSDGYATPALAFATVDSKRAA